MNPSEVLPILKRHGWEPPSWHPSRLLDELPESPSLFYGVDQPDQFLFLPELSDALVPEAHQRALANLAARPANWDRVHVPVLDLTLLTCTDDFLAAERILDPQFLGRAHAELQAPVLIVGIPHRGSIIAMPLLLVDVVVDTLQRTIREAFASGIDEPISEQLFLVEHGELFGRLMFRDRVWRRHDRATSQGESPRPPRSLEIVTTTATNADGTLGVNVAVYSGETLEDVERGIARTLEQVLGAWLGAPTFCGTVVFEVQQPRQPGRDPEGRLATLEASLGAELRSLRTRTGGGLRLTIRLAG